MGGGWPKPTKPYFPVPDPYTLFSRPGVGPQTLGMQFFCYLDGYASIWCKFQLKPSILDPNRNIYANYAHWGGGPLHLSSGCCKELRPKARLLIQTARDRLLKDCLLRNVKRQSFKRWSRAGWNHAGKSPTKCKQDTSWESPGGFVWLLLW